MSKDKFGEEDGLEIDIDTEYADLDVVEIKRLLATSDLTTIDSELLNKHFVLS